MAADLCNLFSRQKRHAEGGNRLGDQPKGNVIESKRKALAMANAASDKKGIEIITIKMRKISGICDYFVIASGTSTTHVRAISDNIIKVLREKGQRLRHIEGEREASWILVDFGDVVGHIFLEGTRKFYDLEKLWRTAPQERFVEPEIAISGKKKKKIASAKKKRVAKKSVKRTSRKIAKKINKKSRKKSK